MLWFGKKKKEEPKKEIDLEKIHFRWVNVYSDKTSNTGLRHQPEVFYNRKRADQGNLRYLQKYPDRKRVACVLFTYELGDGLD